MKRLLLTRHAKSSWDYPDLPDHDRPLNKRGERDCLTMSSRLLEKENSEKQPLEYIFSSSALRALTLAEALSHQLSVPLASSEQWYTFSAVQLLSYLEDLPETYQSIAVVSHNPAVTEVVNRLSDICIDNLPTSGMVSLNCQINSWNQLTHSTHITTYIDYPKKPE